MSLVKMSLLCMTLLLTIVGLSSSVIIESEISPQKGAETKESIMKMNDGVFQCEEDLKGKCDILMKHIVV